MPSKPYSQILLAEKGRGRILDKGDKFEPPQATFQNSVTLDGRRRRFQNSFRIYFMTLRDATPPSSSVLLSSLSQSSFPAICSRFCFTVDPSVDRATILMVLRTVFAASHATSPKNRYCSLYVTPPLCHIKPVTNVFVHSLPSPSLQ